MKNLIFAWILFLPLLSEAFQLSPMVIRFSPTGRGATQVMTVENTGNDKIPIQLEAFTRGVNTKGEEVRAKTEDFNIFPEQLVLLPKETRNIRISWIGKSDGKKEIPYRIVATQLPIEFREKNSAAQNAPGVNLNFLLQYVASAYVRPEGTLPEVKVESFQQASPQKVILQLKNQGSAHQLLKTKSLVLHLADKSKVQVKNTQTIDALNLLAGQVAKVELVLEQALKSSVKSVELNLEDTED